MGISSTGIGSGLDVEGIITKLVALEKQPLVSLQTKATVIQTKISDYSQVKSLVSTLTDAASKLSLDSGWNTVAVAFSNSAAVSATVSGIAAPTTNSAIHNRAAMGASRRDYRSVAPRGDGLYRCETLQEAVVAEFATIVTSPALHAAIDCRAGVLPTRRNGCDIACCGDDLRGDGTSIETIISELAFVVGTPTLHAPIDHHTSVTTTRRQCRDITACRNRLHRVKLHGGSSDTEFTHGIVAPAPHTTTDQRAGVARACRHGSSARSCSDGLHRDQAALDTKIIRYADFACEVVAPTQNPAVNHRTGVIAASRHSCRIASCDNSLHWDAATLNAVIAECAVVIATPTLHPTAHDCTAIDTIA